MDVKISDGLYAALEEAHKFAQINSYGKITTSILCYELFHSIRPAKYDNKYDGKFKEAITNISADALLALEKELLSNLTLSPAPSLPDSTKKMLFDPDLDLLFRIARDILFENLTDPVEDEEKQTQIGIDSFMQALFEDPDTEETIHLVETLKNYSIDFSTDNEDTDLPDIHKINIESDSLPKGLREAVESFINGKPKKEDPKKPEDKKKEEDEGDDDDEEEGSKEAKKPDLEAAGRKSAISSKEVDPNSSTPSLDQFAVNLTNAAKEGAFDPVIGRDKEIEQIIEILCCRKKNNAVLTGDPGCGKTAIIESLAMRIAKNNVPLELRDKIIFSLDLNALVSGTQYRGQFEQRLQDVIKEVTNNKNIIVFIDELHNLIGSGSSSGSGDAANILKPYLARGEFQCIGSTTTDEYRKFIEKDGALKRRFSPVLVEEPTVEQTIEILHGIKDTYGKFHGVFYSDEAIRRCVEWSGKYINDRFFPDKAISVLDMASSLAKLEKRSAAELDELSALEESLRQNTANKAEALEKLDFDGATELRDRGKEIEAEIEKKKESLNNRPAVEVTVDHISRIISKLSNVPIDNIMSSDIQKVRTMKSELESKVIGQEEAVKQLTLALQRNIFGLRDPNKPIASFLLVGPTGTGKTLISKMVAKEFMGSESNLITIACSEYMQDWAESKLLGSAPGYVGYSDSEPRLYVLKRKPYSVILIDEVEKSSSNLYNIWLNMLEEGEITLSSGEKVSCRNCIIIFTGNVGTKALELHGNGVGFETRTGVAKQKADTSIVMAEVKKEFRPEFLNRLTKIVVFNSLGTEELDKIFWIELKKLHDRIKDNTGYELDVTDRIKDLVVSKCEPKYGARSLQRLITEYVEDNINEAILNDESAAQKKKIYLDVDKEENVTVEFK